MFRISALVFVLVNLLACSSSPSPILPPAELTPLENAFPIHRAFTGKLGAGAGDLYLRLTPVVRQGVAYIVDFRGRVVAFDIEKSEIKWQRETAMPIGSSPGITENLVLLGSSHGDVAALDTLTGAERWRTTVSSEVLAPPQSAKGVVVVRCVDGNVYGLSEKTGERLWLTEQRTPALTLRGTSSPVISGDLVLVGYDSGKFVAYNLQSGKVLWQATVAVSQGRTDLERMVDIDSDPIVVDDLVYVVAYQGRLAAIQIGSGRIHWVRDVDSYTGMAIDAYRIYLTNSDGELWAIDRSNGATLWKQSALQRRSLTKPQIHQQYLVVGDFNGFLHWLRRDTGKVVARTRLVLPVGPEEAGVDNENDIKFAKASSILVNPVVSGNKLLAMDRRGNLQIFDMAYP
jgi:outer membrane protein assembly factor BamB